MKLAATLQRLVGAGKGMETAADRLLKVVRNAKITNSKSWREAVRKAYAENGWHATQGKPKEGSTGSPVPRTVRTYVGDVSAAFRFGINVVKARSFYALRQAVVAARRAQAPKKLKKEDAKLIGEPVHDAGALAVKLKGKQHDSFLKELATLVTKYEPFFTERQLEPVKLRRVA